MAKRSLAKRPFKSRDKGTKRAAAPNVVPSNPPVVVTLAPDAGKGAYALQFIDSLRVVYMVRQGKEASDEAALRKQIVERKGAPLVVAFGGSDVATVFDTEWEPGCYFRILALVP